MKSDIFVIRCIFPDIELLRKLSKQNGSAIEISSFISPRSSRPPSPPPNIYQHSSPAVSPSPPTSVGGRGADAENSPSPLYSKTSPIIVPVSRLDEIPALPSSPSGKRISVPRLDLSSSRAIVQSNPGHDHVDRGNGGSPDRIGQGRRQTGNGIREATQSPTAGHGEQLRSSGRVLLSHSSTARVRADLRDSIGNFPSQAQWVRKL